MNCTCEQDVSGKCACSSNGEDEVRACCCTCCDCDECDCTLESENDVETQSDDSDYESSSEEDTDNESEDDYEEVDDDKVSILRGKWIYDGSVSIDEMIEALQREIALLNDLKDDGWVLQEKVSEDHAVLVKADV
jgi:hypothetical protein